MTARAPRALLLAALVVMLAPPLRAQGRSMNSLDTDEIAAGWQLLFDGTSTAQWRGYHSDSMPAGWHAEQGLLVKSGSTNDIITRAEYRDFELDLEWRIERGGNAGIFYRATEEYPKVYWTGPEYQLLDDPNHPDGRNRLTSAAAAYGLYPSPAGVVHPAGEWNRTRIIVQGNHVEHWLNGTRVVSYELGSADWQEKVNASKFAAWPQYGRAARGHIAIQGDHNGELALRNIKILPR